MRFTRKRHRWMFAVAACLVTGRAHAEQWADEPPPEPVAPESARPADGSRLTFTVGVHAGTANEAAGPELLVGLRAGGRLWLSRRLLATLAAEYDLVTSEDVAPFGPQIWGSGTAWHHRLAVTLRLEVSHRRLEATTSVPHGLPRVSLGVLLSPTVIFFGVPRGSLLLPPPPAPGARLGLGLYLTRPEPSGAWIPVFVEFAGTAIVLEGKGYPGLRLVVGVGL